MSNFTRDQIAGLAAGIPQSTLPAAADLRNRIRAAASLADEGMYLAMLETEGVLAGRRVHVPAARFAPGHHVTTDEAFAARLEAATAGHGTKR